MKFSSTISILILILVFTVVTMGCTSPGASIFAKTRSEPFVGTWQQTDSNVRFQILENHSVIATSDNPCDFSLLSKGGPYRCTNYTFTEGNWTYSQDDTYNVTLTGNVSLESTGIIRTPYKSLEMTQISYFNFGYQNETDSLITNWGYLKGKWQRAS